METKKKTRSAQTAQRDRSGKKAKSAASRRTDSTRRREQPDGRGQQGERRREQAARRPEQRAPRQEQQARKRETDAETHRRQVEAAAEGTPEMVFRMDAKEEQKSQRQTPRDPAQAKRAEQRRRSAQRTQERKKQAARRSKAPKVVYTQPRPFNLNRLVLQLAIVMAVVLAITLGLSVFFKVENVVVYGNEAYSAWAVQEASGIEGGEKLLTFGRIRACGKIKAALPYVDTVRIGINLPNTVNIYITEFDVVYSIRSENGTWWLMTSDGRIVEQTDSGTASSYTKVLGVELDSPTLGEQAVAYQEVVVTEATTETQATDATVAAPVTVTAAQRLDAALEILTSLERNDLVGEVASVDVTSLNSIEMWYGNQYQVRLGSANDPNHDLDYKIAAMKASVAQLSDYQTGILDVSFTTWTDRVGYTPFE